MRGSPLGRACLVFALLLCLAPALWKLTSADAAAPKAAPVQKAVEAQEIPIELAFTTPPARVTITHLSKVVWEKSALESTDEATLTIPWPKEGGELVFSIEWPNDAPLSAMRVRLRDPERGQIERSLWGRGTKTGVLGFP